MYYFFLVKNKVKEKRSNKKKETFQDRLKKLNFDKNFEDIIGNEIDFHGYGTAKIEIQQQQNDINPFKCELHQTLLDVLDFNPAYKLIHPGLPI